MALTLGQQLRVLQVQNLFAVDGWMASGENQHVPVPGFNDGFPAHLDLVDAGQAQAFVRAQKRQGCFLPVRRARGALSVRANVCFFAAPQ